VAVEQVAEGVEFADAPFGGSGHRAQQAIITISARQSTTRHGMSPPTSQACPATSHKTLTLAE